MILGLFLRYFKTYNGINYIPISNGEKFCGLVGINGIGKSSVLEALDSIFNNKPWNFNIHVKRRGKAATNPYITPIFFIPCMHISTTNRNLAEKLSKAIWEMDESDIASTNKSLFKIFEEQRSVLQRDYDTSSYFLLPIGVSYDGKINLSIFNNKKLAEMLFEDLESTTIQDESLATLKNLYDEIINKYDYIYIPKDIDPELFTQLETHEVQKLMGESLMQIIERLVPSGKIQEINVKLNEFISGLSSVLTNYSFRTPTDRQQNLRKNDVYDLIIEAFFKIRKLHKSNGDHWLELNILSSGEKQQAIIEIASCLLEKYRKATSKLIIAIDEPESSLHMSACYDQFNKLFEMSNLTEQLLFTTHWYGFIPTVDKGYVTVISRVDEEHKVDLINISSYREAMKQTVRDSKGKLPYDIRLKSMNDFIQSIITSILGEDPFNWLICEGSSEKIYFEKYFEDIKKEKKLRIIPVGGAAEIKRIYNYLVVAYEDFKKEIKGKVILISDTDKEIVQYPVRSDYPNLLCFRIVNDETKQRTLIVKVDSVNVSPKTEIEDSLNGKLFFETLKGFQAENEELLSILSEIEDPSEKESYFSLDLSPSKQKLLEAFFNKQSVKFAFARKYSEGISLEYNTPDWITEIKAMY